MILSKKTHPLGQLTPSTGFKIVNELIYLIQIELTMYF